MGSGIRNQKNREYINSKQNFKTYRDRGGIGDKSTSLTKLIGVKRVIQQNFEYEGTYYVTEDGETYDNKYVNTHKPQRIGIPFYEVSNWIYNKEKETYQPIIRRIVIIKIKENQQSLNL